VMILLATPMDVMELVLLGPCVLKCGVWLRARAYVFYVCLSVKSFSAFASKFAQARLRECEIQFKIELVEHLLGDGGVGFMIAWRAPKYMHIYSLNTYTH